MNFKGIIFKEYKELPTQELDPDTKNEFIEIHRSRTPWKTYFIIAILANLATFAFLYTEHRKIPHEAVPQDFGNYYLFFREFQVMRTKRRCSQSV